MKDALMKTSLTSMSIGKIVQEQFWCENVESKIVLFRNKFREQINHLINNKIRNLSGTWCYATVIMLLKEFTFGHARIKSNKKSKISS